MSRLAISEAALSEVAGSKEVAAGKTAFGQDRTTAILTVIVPVYNEVQTIDELLRRVVAAPYWKQVVVVDDSSTDGTVEVLEKWEDHPEVVLLQHTRNRGKGAAIRTGLEYAEGYFTVIQDADLEYDPQDYARIIEPLLSGEAEVVYGSRYLREAGHPRQPWRLLRFGVFVLNAFVRLVYGTRLTDEATCYKAFPTAVLRSMDLECERFEFCPEVTAKACRMGLKITEVPIRYRSRTIEAGKKIRWIDGVAALRTLWRWHSWRPTTVVATQRGMRKGFSEGALGWTRDASRAGAGGAELAPAIQVVRQVGK